MSFETKSIMEICYSMRMHLNCWRNIWHETEHDLWMLDLAAVILLLVWL